MLGKAQLIIIIITIILMVVSFSMLIWSFRQIKKDELWPPINQKCPDYWTIDASGNCIGATVNMGTSCSYAGYTSANFGTNVCTMYQWTQGATGITGITANNQSIAVGCTGVRWDGISYGYGLNNPCYVESE